MCAYILCGSSVPNGFLCRCFVRTSLRHQSFVLLQLVVLCRTRHHDANHFLCCISFNPCGIELVNNFICWHLLCGDTTIFIVKIVERGRIRESWMFRSHIFLFAINYIIEWRLLGATQCAQRSQFLEQWCWFLFFYFVMSGLFRTTTMTNENVNL